MTIEVESKEAMDFLEDAVKHYKYCNKSDWIPLSDCLPEMEKCGDVWISETVLVAHHMAIGFGYFKKRKEDDPVVFVGYDDDFDVHRDPYPEDLEMTHRMSLPKLPEVEKE